MQVQVQNPTGAAPVEVFSGGAPPGDKAYKCVVTSTGVEPNKDGDGQNWVIKATVVEGPETGGLCQSYIGLPKGDAKDGSRIGKIGGMLVALGLRTEAQVRTNFAYDTDEAMGRQCVVYVQEKGVNQKGQRDTEQTFVWPQNWNAALAGQWNPKDAAKSAGKPPHPAGPGSTVLPPGQPMQIPPQQPPPPPPQQPGGQPPMTWQAPPNPAQQPPNGWQAPPAGWTPPPAQ